MPWLKPLLNAMIEAINAMHDHRGDGTFISVDTGPGGRVTSFSLPALLRRIPHYHGEQSAILFGYPSAVYDSQQSTLDMVPCDSNGVATGEANVTVQAGWTLLTGQTIPVTAIIPYQQAADGNYYVIGRPKQVVSPGDATDGFGGVWQDTTNGLLQQRFVLDFGAFCSTVSGWQTIDTESCAQPCTSESGASIVIGGPFA